MRDRIRQLRQSLNLSQEEFGRKIGVTRGVIANIELDRAGLNDVLVQHICDVFGVSRSWLETGEGEMFQDMSDDAEFEMLCTEIALSEDEFIKRVMRAYWKLPEKDKQMVRNLIDEISGT